MAAILVHILSFFRNCAETWYIGVFGVADYESGVRIVKFKMED